MKKVKNSKLLKLLIILVDVLLSLYLIKMCKITHFCCTILSLISPLFIGYVIAWVFKPLVNMLSSKLNIKVSYSIILLYIFLVLVLFLFCYFLFPFIINEIKNLIPVLREFYYMIPREYISNINIGKISSMVVSVTINVKDIILSLFYSFFISFYFLRDNKMVTRVLAKFTPSSLINEISCNLRLFVKGTLLDTFILFVMTLVLFNIFNIPYALILSIFISITNIIPYVGPYIGGIPCVLISLSVSYKLAIVSLILVVVLQFIESSFIHPIIMSKSLNLHPISILIGLIVFGHFFGIVGMVISTPLVSIIKSLYIYYKPFNKLLKR